MEPLITAIQSSVIVLSLILRVFNKAQEELALIKNLILVVYGSSQIAHDYG